MKTRRFWLISAAGAIAAGVAIAALVAFFLFSRPSEVLATSADGRIRFITVKRESGTSFSTAFGSRLEAWARDALFYIGFRKVQRTSFKMTSPAGSHLFIMEYSGDIGDVKPSFIQAEVMKPDGTKYPLITVGGNNYGLQRRQFAYWVLNRVPHLDGQGLKLKVYLPEDDPIILPLPKE